MKVPLSLRLFISYAGVVVVGAGVAYLTIRLLAPRLFDHQLGMMNGVGLAGMSMGDTAAGDLRSAFLSALSTALVVGMLASIVVAGVVAALVTRRLLRPLDAVRRATRGIAAGSYAVRVPIPSEPELAALATDVNTLAMALADTEARRVRLLGDVAHEMRTPLTVLDGYVEGLIDGVFPSGPDTFASLSEELRRLHRLAQDLSSLSRAEEQHVDVHPVDTDLADLARRTALRLLPQFQDMAVTLSVNADEEVPVCVDPDRITQVLTNLLGNALLATPAGGAVAVTAAAAAGRGVVVVTDTGSGLAEEDLDRIFERFYRVQGSSRRSGGSGIGLTIARGITRSYAGDVTAASAGKGHGASFSLTLPLRLHDSGDRLARQ
jgi:signal transduction histidine kinase